MGNLDYDFIIDRDTNKKCLVKYPNIRPWNSGTFIEFAKNKILCIKKLIWELRMNHLYYLN
jgi:hypothetical protein